MTPCQVPLAFLNSRQIVYVLVVVIAIAMVGIGGWYVYTNFFAKQPVQPKLASKPNYKLEYTLIGKVKEINRDTGKLVVVDEFTSTNYTFKINSFTKVFLGNEEVDISTIEKDKNVLIRSNSDFTNENVNIFEVSIIQPTSLPVGDQGKEMENIDLPK